RHVSDIGQTPVDVDIDLAMTQNLSVVESDRSVIIALEPTRTDDEIRFETNRSVAAVVESVASDLAVIFANQTTKPDAPVAVVESVRPVMTRAVESSSDVPVDSYSYRTIQPVIDGDTVLAVPDVAESPVTINEVVGTTASR